jgi:hypothetical protein
VSAHSSDTEWAVCRQAACAMEKYFKFKRIEHCINKGVDKANRDGAGMNINDVKDLASVIKGIGFDPRELEKSVTVWLDGPVVYCDTLGIWLDEQVVYNVEMCAQSEAWPQMDERTARSMTQTTLIGSHGNYVSRCFYIGCVSSDPAFADSSGMMCMNQLRVLDPVWAAEIERGSLTTVLESAIRKEPELLNAVIISDNIKQGANMTEHSIQRLRRMWDFMSPFMAGVVSDTCREWIFRRYMRTRGHQGKDVDSSEARNFFNCANRLGNGAAIQKLSEFRAAHLTSGKSRDAPAEFYGWVAEIAADMNRLRTAIIMAQLSCPVNDVHSGVCTYITQGNVRSLQQGGALFVQAKQAEDFLKKMQRGLEKAVASREITAEDAFKAEVSFNVWTVRALLGKKPLKYPTFEAIAAEFWPGTRDTCPWSVTSREPPPQEESEEPDGEPAGAVAMLPVNDDGEVREDALCKDSGFTEQVYVRQVRLGLAPESKHDVWQVERYIIRQGNVWVYLKAKTDGVYDMSIPASRLREQFELAKKPRERKWLETAPFLPLYNPLGSLNKALYTMAMHKAFELAEQDWKLVDIMTVPRVAVMAKQQLSQGWQFMVVSTSVLFDQDPTKLTQAAFCVSDAGTYVMPATSIHRERTEKVSIASTGASHTKFDHFVNVASMIRIESAEEAEKSKAVLNCKIGIMRYPVVLSAQGTASEYMANVPYIELSQQVEAGQELIAEANPMVWHKPRTRPAAIKQIKNAGLVKEPPKKKQKMD